MKNSQATAGLIPPLVIRGESLPEQTEGEFLVDTLSFTVLREDFEVYTGGDLCMFTQDEEGVLKLFEDFLYILFGPSIQHDGALKGGRNFFDHSIPLKDSAGFIAFGGNNTVQDYDSDTEKVKLVDERLQIYISGEGCQKVRDWVRVSTRLKTMCARLTRVDLAFDDHAGTNDLEKCKALYQGGEFTSSGRPPKATYIDDLSNNTGKTMYVGNRKNGKMLRCYEKGRALGEEGSPWVRWEMEYHSKDRVIPYDALIQVAEYIAGSYPALSFIADIQIKIQTDKLKLQIQYKKLKKICKTQYGKLLNFAHLEIGLTPEQTFYEMLNPDGFPDRLAWASTKGEQ